MPEKLILENDSTFVYYIDVEKGVVAAVMEDPIMEAESFINKIARAMNDNGVNICGAGEIVSAYLSSPIRAKATCSEDDEFDLEYGMELAKNRCFAKYYKKLTQVFVDLNNKVDPLLCFLEDKIISCAEKYERFNDASTIK